MYDTAKRMREALSSRRLKTTEVSVRRRDAGYSDAYYVTLRDDGIAMDFVRDLLRKFESIDRDEATGEILLGGNTYIHYVRKWRHGHAPSIRDNFRKMIADVSAMNDGCGLRYGNMFFMKDGESIVVSGGDMRTCVWMGNDDYCETAWDLVYEKMLNDKYAAYLKLGKLV